MHSFLQHHHCGELVPKRMSLLVMVPLFTDKWKEQEFDVCDGNDVRVYEEIFGRRLKIESIVSRVRELVQVRHHILNMDNLAQAGRIPCWHPSFPTH